MAITPAVFWDIDGNRITPDDYDNIDDDDGDDDDPDILPAFDPRDDHADGFNALMLMQLVPHQQQTVDLVTDASSSSIATSMTEMDDQPIDLFSDEVWQSLLPSSFSDDIF